ncbi:hypothetical protein D9756_008699 [Leucocoprinus leucothites]|uniref:RING-type domain-containing protein n=1 Tax=Leucocoprinus leucothites TaxID=201217 RepID=A0A8H5FVW0_9AGAR|nr:hypothetical protein D9756_008699 [Leucoagaricus leucothites]
MPTRQPTPGPSTLTTASDVLQPHNAKKRAVSEIPPDDEPRQTKKHRKDLEILNGDEKAIASLNSNKDGKKKRKKKKRKSPLTIPEIESEQTTQASTKPKSAITVVPVSLASSLTLSEASLPSPTVYTALAPNLENVLRAESLVSVAEEEEKPALTAADKGKGRATSEHPDTLIMQGQGSTPVAGSSQETDSMKGAQAKIAELTAQLQSQKTLLSRYEDNLSHLQQSLICEICLDFLYKPFALSPCGHVACYMCLVRWFTSVQNHVGGGNDQHNVNPPAELNDIPRLLNSRTANRGTFLRNRKSCPLCRASITSRPAEVWSIKSMVANLIKSKLVDPPSAPPPSATETPDADGINNHRNDPWRNVFPKSRHERDYHHPPQFYPPPPENNEGEEWGIEDMGMYDAEDGGIYRCLDCMHEIWGGVCTSCNREYPGHARFDNDDDGDEDDFGAGGYLGGNVLGRRLREIIQGYHEPLGWGPEDDEGGDDDDDEIDMGEFYDAHGDPMELTDDESVSSEGSQGLHTADEEWTTEDDDEEGEDEEADEYNPRYHFDGLGLLPGRMLRGIPLFPQHHREVEYEGSFIDDGEDDHGHYPEHREGDEGGADGQWDRHQRFGDYEDEDDEDDEHFDAQTMARRLGRGMRLGGPVADDVGPIPLPRRSYLDVYSGRGASSVSGDDDQEDDEVEVEVVPPTHPSRGPRHRQTAVVDVDEDDGGNEEGQDEEEDEEVQEVRSLGRRRPMTSRTGLPARRSRRVQRYYSDESE